jgi:hypothetical protein
MRRVVWLTGSCQRTMDATPQALCVEIFIWAVFIQATFIRASSIRAPFICHRTVTFDTGATQSEKPGQVFGIAELNGRV